MRERGQWEMPEQETWAAVEAGRPAESLTGGGAIAVAPLSLHVSPGEWKAPEIPQEDTFRHWRSCRKILQMRAGRSTWPPEKTI